MPTPTINHSTKKLFTISQTLVILSIQILPSLSSKIQVKIGKKINVFRLIFAPNTLTFVNNFLLIFWGGGNIFLNPFAYAC
jgi:hypothetical protein